jgi:hypothetical protein
MFTYKVKSSCLTNYHAMKMYPVLNKAAQHHAIMTYGVVKVQLHAFLTSALDRGESVSRPSRFIPAEKSPRYPLDWRLGGSHSQSGSGGDKKKPWPCRESNPGRPSRSRVTILTELSSFLLCAKDLVLKFSA